MAITALNIARVGVARVGLARLNYGTASYDAEIAVIATSGAILFLPDYIYQPTGQVDISGTVPVDDFDVVYVGSGLGIDIVGSAPFEIANVYFYTASGGVDATGAAIGIEANYTGDASGAMATAGAALVDLEFVGLASGQVDVTGSPPFEIGFVGNASGQADTSGAAGFQADYLHTATGQVDTSGSADFSPTYTPDASGFATTDGAAEVTLEFMFSATGQATASGEATDLVADYKSEVVIAEITMGGEAIVLFTIDKKGLPVFLRKFDGDVKLVMSIDGGLITVSAGQPEMDGGLQTAVNISLFTDIGWWGNSIIGTGNEVGSTFADALRKPLTNQSRLEIIEAAKDALSWLLSTGIAETIDISASIPSVGRLDMGIRIQQPEKAPELFRYNVNWANQKIIMTEAAA